MKDMVPYLYLVAMVTFPSRDNFVIIKPCLYARAGHRGSDYCLVFLQFFFFFFISQEKGENSLHVTVLGLQRDQMHH